MTRTWNVTLHFFDAVDSLHGGATEAHAVLTTSRGSTFDGYGRAPRLTRGRPVDDVDESVAAAAALRHLAQQLRASAEEFVDVV
jgi:hypothetical protein